MKCFKTTSRVYLPLAHHYGYNRPTGGRVIAANVSQFFRSLPKFSFATHLNPTGETRSKPPYTVLYYADCLPDLPVNRKITQQILFRDLRSEFMVAPVHLDSSYNYNCRPHLLVPTTIIFPPIATSSGLYALNWYSQTNPMYVTHLGRPAGSITQAHPWQLGRNPKRKQYEQLLYCGQNSARSDPVANPSGNIMSLLPVNLMVSYLQNTERWIQQYFIAHVIIDKSDHSFKTCSWFKYDGALTEGCYTELMFRWSIRFGCKRGYR